MNSLLQVVATPSPPKKILECFYFYSMGGLIYEKQITIVFCKCLV